MRIAVAGATGNIGARTASSLEREGHEVTPVSRSLGAPAWGRQRGRARRRLARTCCPKRVTCE